MKRKEHSGLIFGVHSFGRAGMAEGIATGAPDNFDKIGQAIMELKGDAKDFLVRSYLHFTGENSAEEVLAEIGQLLQIEIS